MSDIHIDKVGNMAVVECEGRFVKSETAFQLREAVTSQTGARTVVLEVARPPLRIHSPGCISTSPPRSRRARLGRKDC